VSEGVALGCSVCLPPNRFDPFKLAEGKCIVKFFFTPLGVRAENQGKNENNPKIISTLKGWEITACPELPFFDTLSPKGDRIEPEIPSKFKP